VSVALKVFFLNSCRKRSKWTWVCWFPISSLPEQVDCVQGGNWGGWPKVTWKLLPLPPFYRTTCVSWHP